MKTKLQMAINIASTLFNQEVTEDNWKVKRLVKKSKKDLAFHDEWADRVNARLARDHEFVESAVKLT